MSCCLGAQIPGYGHSRNCVGSMGYYDEKLDTVVHKGTPGDDAEITRLREALKVARDGLADVNSYLQNQKVYDNTNGKHTRLLECMGVTDALTRIDAILEGKE